MMQGAASKVVKTLLRLLNLEIRTVALPFFADNIHSAAGEDGILGGFISKLPGIPRFIVDLGANDGLTGSVSRNLILNGWSGTLVEPFSPAYAVLKSTYGSSNVQLLNVAVSPAPDAKMEAVTWHGHFENLPVPARYVNDLLSELPVSPLTGVGVLKVDLDGMDNSILAAINFERFSPWLVVAEVDSEQLANLDEQNQIMQERGFHLVLHKGNAYYVARDRVAELLFQNRKMNIPNQTVLTRKN